MAWFLIRAFIRSLTVLKLNRTALIKIKCQKKICFIKSQQWLYPPTQPHSVFINIFNRGGNCAFHLNKSHNLKAWMCLKSNRLLQTHITSGSAAPRDGPSRNGKADTFGTLCACLTLIFHGAHSTVP